MQVESTGSSLPKGASGWKEKEVMSIEELLPIGFIDSLRAQKVGPNEILYEDQYVIVERKDNTIYQTGKPLRMPLIYFTPPAPSAPAEPQKES